jgi:hypothetical protein
MPLEWLNWPSPPPAKPPLVMIIVSRSTSCAGFLRSAPTLIRVANEFSNTYSEMIPSKEYITDSNRLCIHPIPLECLLQEGYPDQPASQ